MSLGKLPAIKGLVSTSQSKRRFKSDLSPDMISPPLGDFRHTLHVGRGGDVFGDTSFLSNYGGPTNDAGPAHPDSPSGSKTTRFLSRTLRHIRKPPPGGGSRDLSSAPPSVSPLIKNSMSLPQLDLQRALLSSSSPDQTLFTHGLLDSGFITLPRFSRLDENFREASVGLCSGHRRGSLPENSDRSLTRSDSLTSFTVDLGPSLMTEVLALIDSSTSLFSSSKECDMEEEEEPASVFESSSGSPQHHDDDERPAADVSVRCPARAEVRIEPQRFQQAASVLSRHFGGGGGLTRSFRHRRALYTFTETEEEIKV